MRTTWAVTALVGLVTAAAAVAHFADAPSLLTFGLATLALAGLAWLVSFANALFVLGLVILGGSFQSSDGVMRFHPRLAKDNATLMMLASFLIVILGLSAATGDKASHHVKAISIVGAVALLVTYCVWLVDYIRADVKPDVVHAEPQISMTVALGLLAVAGVGAAFVSDWFIDALSP